MVKCLLEFSDFPSFCQDLVKELHASKYFADITLIGDDNIPLKAHKIVLGAHSSLLKQAVTSIGCDKIVLKCNGFKSHDIKSLLDFIYLGEVSSEYKDANILFKLGKFLQIRHLGEECDLGLEELSKEFQIEAIEVIREEAAKGEHVKAEVENNGKEENVTTIVYKARDVDMKSTSSEFENCVIADQSLFDVNVERKNKIDTDSEEYFDDKKQGKKIYADRTEATAIRLYNSVMKSFNKTDPSKEWKSLDETNEDEMNTNLCKFFMCLVKPDGAPYNSSTLYLYHQRIKRYLLSTRNINLDKDGRYKDVYDTVKRQRDASECSGEEAGIHSSSALREEDIQTCFMAGTMGIGNPQALLTLVIFNLMTDFGCNTGQELHGLLNSDLIYGPLNESSEPEYIQLSDRALKYRRKIRGCDKEKDDNKGRVYLDTGLHGTCPIKNILLYQKMKTPYPQLEPEHPFLLNPVRTDNPRKNQKWFDNLRLGRNSLVRVFKVAFLEAGIDISSKKISLSSARKTRLNHNLRRYL